MPAFFSGKHFSTKAFQIWHFSHIKQQFFPHQTTIFLTSNYNFPHVKLQFYPTSNYNFTPHHTTFFPHQTTILPHIKLQFFPHRTTILRHVKLQFFPHQTTIFPTSNYNFSPHQTTIFPTSNYILRPNIFHPEVYNHYSRALWLFCNLSYHHLRHPVVMGGCPSSVLPLLCVSTKVDCFYNATIQYNI
jgi:hypothetical protein